MKLSRNDPCWCGSGKKYKKCHLADDLEKGKKPGKPLSPYPGVIIKSEKQIQGIRESSQLTKEIFEIISGEIQEGITTDYINSLVHELTIKHGGIPAPLNYNGFPKSVCTSINNVICHGIPDETILKNGDIINIDITTILNGFYGDSSRMYIIGEASEEAVHLVKVARECLFEGIKRVKPYSDIGEIGYYIEKHASKNNFSVVKDYGGHGTGVNFHEEPHIHHYGRKRRGIAMLPGMVFTIEPMINAGKHQSKLLSDNWTAVTADGSLSAQWEHTILVTETGHEILTA